MSSLIYFKAYQIINRLLSAVLLVVFLTTSVIPPNFSWAQMGLALPAIGTPLSLTPTFHPLIIRGVNLYANDPLKFDFILDKGNAQLDEKAYREEANKLVKYFLASLTIPEDQMWVNLSPSEKNRIVPEEFGQTEMGRDLLAQDYLLKQLTAALVGKNLSDELNRRGASPWAPDNGRTQGSVPTEILNRIWIVPENATIYEHEKGAFVVKSHLKVMMEEDYLAKTNENNVEKVLKPFPEQNSSSNVIHTEILPHIEREVNEGKTFAPLRQIYNSMILASWYKKNLQQSLLGQIYVNQAKTNGVTIDDKDSNQKIYNQYLEAFKKGVYDYVKEAYDPATQEIIARNYFTGGAKLNGKFTVSSDTEDINRSIASIKEPATMTVALKKSDNIPKINNGPSDRSSANIPNARKFALNIFNQIKTIHPDIILDTRSTLDVIYIISPSGDKLFEVSFSDKYNAIDLIIHGAENVKYVITRIESSKYTLQLNPNMENKSIREFTVLVGRAGEMVPEEMEVDNYIQLLLATEKHLIALAEFTPDEARFVAAVTTAISEDYDTAENILTSDNIPRITPEMAKTFYDNLDSNRYKEVTQNLIYDLQDDEDLLNRYFISDSLHEEETPTDSVEKNIKFPSFLYALLKAINGSKNFADPNPSEINSKQDDRSVANTRFQEFNLNSPIQRAELTELQKFYEVGYFLNTLYKITKDNKKAITKSEFRIAYSHVKTQIHPKTLTEYSEIIKLASYLLTGQILDETDLEKELYTYNAQVVERMRISLLLYFAIIIKASPTNIHIKEKSIKVREILLDYIQSTKRSNIVFSAMNPEQIISTHTDDALQIISRGLNIAMGNVKNSDRAISTSIIVVDDDSAIRSNTIKTLKEKFPDIKITEASDGDEVAELLRQHPEIEIVISDLKMKRINGDMLASNLNSTHPTISVFLLTGEQNEGENSDDTLKKGRPNIQQVIRKGTRETKRILLEGLTNILTTLTAKRAAEEGNHSVANKAMISQIQKAVYTQISERFERNPNVYFENDTTNNNTFSDKDDAHSAQDKIKELTDANIASHLSVTPDGELVVHLHFGKSSEEDTGLQVIVTKLPSEVDILNMDIATVIRRIELKPNSLLGEKSTVIKGDIGYEDEAHLNSKFVELGVIPDRKPDWQEKLEWIELAAKRIIAKKIKSIHEALKKEPQYVIRQSTSHQGIFEMCPSRLATTQSKSSGVVFPPLQKIPSWQLEKKVTNDSDDRAVGAIPKDVGGIDLNPNMVDVTIQKNGHGVIMPKFTGNIEDFKNFSGFTPVIINIKPITNMPLLLGMLDKNQETESSTRKMEQGRELDLLSAVRL